MSLDSSNEPDNIMACSPLHAAWAPHLSYVQHVCHKSSDVFHKLEIYAIFCKSFNKFPKIFLQTMSMAIKQELEDANIYCCVYQRGLFKNELLVI